MTTSANAPHRISRRPTLPPLVLPDDTLELLKWFALLTMVIDHANKYLLSASQPWMLYIGRLAMPIFTAVLAYNLARPGAIDKGVYKRTFWRLILFGAITMPSFVALGATYDDSFWPLNILFLFATLVACLWLIEQKTLGTKVAMVVVFVIVGYLVEYFWFGLGFGIAVWYYSKRPSRTAAFFAVLSCALLNLLTNTYWSLLALPILFLAPRIRIRVPRLRLFFYAFYPLHFALFWCIQHFTGVGLR
jgi:hypothetical protein